MKKIFLMLALCCVSLTGVVAQYSPVTIRTPNGSVVPDTGVLTGPDISMTYGDLVALSDDLRVNYNGATMVGVPTRTYNCHAYAWHTTEGGNNVWIGVSSTTAHNAYWTDGSYLEVAENASTKVVYTGNHSAIRIDSNWYQSKWGSNALVKHHPNNVPSIYLPSSPKHYYVKRQNIPGISGGTIGSDQTILIGTSPRPLTNITSASGGYGQLTYQWQLKQGNSTSWYDLNNATQPTYAPSLLVQSIIYSYRRRVTDELGRVAYSNTVNITVEAAGPLSAGEIAPATQSISMNSTPSRITNSRSASGGNGTITYRWESNINTYTSGWSDTYATGETYQPSRLTKTTYFRRVATSGSQTAYSNVVVVNVIGSPLSGGEIRMPAVVDLGSQHGPITNSIGATGGNGSYSYQWQSSSPANPTNFTNVSGATGLEYQPPVASLSTPGSGPGPFLAILYRRMVTSGSEVAYSNTVPLMVWNR